MSHGPTLLVLAAGMGSRYGGLKQLDPMGPNGETMLDYSVYDAIRAGFTRIVFVIRQDIESAFRESIGERYAGRIAIDYAFQELEDLPKGFTVPEGRSKPWGTAHAMRAARGGIDGDFAVINADDFYGSDAYRALVEYFSKCAESGMAPMSMVAYPLANTLSTHGSVNRGLCRVENGKLVSVEEVTGIHKVEGEPLKGIGEDGKAKVLDPASLVSMNCWGFSSAIFEPLETGFRDFLAERSSDLKAEFYIPTFIDGLIRSGECSCDVLTAESSWFGVTYPLDKPFVQGKLDELIEAGLYPTPLMN